MTSAFDNLMVGVVDMVRYIRLWRVIKWLKRNSFIHEWKSEAIVKHVAFVLGRFKSQDVKVILRSLNKPEDSRFDLLSALVVAGVLHDRGQNEYWMDPAARTEYEVWLTQRMTIRECGQDVNLRPDASNSSSIAQLSLIPPTAADPGVGKLNVPDDLVALNSSCADHTIPSQAVELHEIQGKVAVGIITIREDEFLAVLHRFPVRKTVRGGRQFYEYASVSTAENTELGVVVFRCPDQGEGVAQGVTRDLIDDVNPPWLFLVGIAGGIPSDDYSLGDVALATRLNDFSISAAIEGKPREFNVAGGPMHQDVENLLAHLPAFEERLRGWNEQQSLHVEKPKIEIPDSLDNTCFYGNPDWRRKVRNSLNANFPPARQLRPPKIFDAPTISSDTLTKDTELADQWHKVARKTSTVEMELGGVYHAARRAGTRDYRILAIRGISDIVGFKRSGEWTEFACHSAAAFAAALIKSGIILLSPRLDTHHRAGATLGEVPSSGVLVPSHQSKENVRPKDGPPAPCIDLPKNGQNQYFARLCWGELAQVRDFSADFQNFGTQSKRKSFAGGARVGESRCSEDLPR